MTGAVLMDSAQVGSCCEALLDFHGSTDDTSTVAVGNQALGGPGPHVPSLLVFSCPRGGAAVGLVQCTKANSGISSTLVLQRSSLLSSRQLSHACAPMAQKMLCESKCGDSRRAETARC